MTGIRITTVMIIDRYPDFLDAAHIQPRTAPDHREPDWREHREAGVIEEGLHQVFREESWVDDRVDRPPEPFEIGEDERPEGPETRAKPLVGATLDG